MSPFPEAFPDFSIHSGYCLPFTHLLSYSESMNLSKVTSGPHVAKSKAHSQFLLCMTSPQQLTHLIYPLITLSLLPYPFLWPYTLLALHLLCPSIPLSLYIQSVNVTISQAFSHLSSWLYYLTCKSSTPQ